MLAIVAAGERNTPQWSLWRWIYYTVCFLIASLVGFYLVVIGVATWTTLLRSDRGVATRSHGHAEPFHLADAVESVVVYPVLETIIFVALIGFVQRHTRSRLAQMVVPVGAMALGAAAWATAMGNPWTTVLVAGVGWCWLFTIQSFAYRRWATISKTAAFVSILVIHILHFATLFGLAWVFRRPD
jgi:hypothetical protein